MAVEVAGAGYRLQYEIFLAVLWTEQCSKFGQDTGQLSAKPEFE